MASTNPNVTSPTGTGNDVACVCETEDRNVGYTLHGVGDECLVHARGRQCLFQTSDFSGCDPLEPEDSCRAVCDLLTARVASDAERSYEVEVRSTRCHMNKCRLLVDIEGTCFVDLEELPFECTLSDEEILDRAVEEGL